MGFDVVREGFVPLEPSRPELSMLSEIFSMRVAGVSRVPCKSSRREYPKGETPGFYVIGRRSVRVSLS